MCKASIFFLGLKNCLKTWTQQLKKWKKIWKIGQHIPLLMYHGFFSKPWYWQKNKRLTISLLMEILDDSMQMDQNYSKSSWYLFTKIYFKSQKPGKKGVYKEFEICLDVTLWMGHKILQDLKTCSVLKRNQDFKWCILSTWYLSRNA